MSKWETPKSWKMDYLFLFLHACLFTRFKSHLFILPRIPLCGLREPWSSMSLKEKGFCSESWELSVVIGQTPVQMKALCLFLFINIHLSAYGLAKFVLLKPWHVTGVCYLWFHNIYLHKKLSSQITPDVLLIYLLNNLTKTMQCILLKLHITHRSILNNDNWGTRSYYCPY